jgi:hypothetical protein
VPDVLEIVLVLAGVVGAVRMLRAITEGRRSSGGNGGRDDDDEPPPPIVDLF